MLGEAEFLEGAFRREVELRGARRHAEGAGPNVEVLAVAVEQEDGNRTPPSQEDSSPVNSRRRSSIGFADRRISPAFLVKSSGTLLPIHPHPDPQPDGFPAASMNSAGRTASPPGAIKGVSNLRNVSPGFSSAADTVKDGDGGGGGGGTVTATDGGGVGGGGCSGPFSGISTSISDRSSIRPGSHFRHPKRRRLHVDLPNRGLRSFFHRCRGRHFELDLDRGTGRRRADVLSLFPDFLDVGNLLEGIAHLRGEGLPDLRVGEIPQVVVHRHLPRHQQGFPEVGEDHPGDPHQRLGNPLSVGRDRSKVGTCRKFSAVSSSATGATFRRSRLLY